MVFREKRTQKKKAKNKNIYKVILSDLNETETNVRKSTENAPLNTLYFENFGLFKENKEKLTSIFYYIS